MAVCLLVVMVGSTSYGKAHATLLTRWAADVSPENVLPEYPRPHLVRDEWQNLNGTWKLAVTESNARKPRVFTETVLVPFPLESHLSGYEKTLSPSERAWYQREFEINKSWSKQKVLLHFGAVDWKCVVWINGLKVGKHVGGYDPFSFDITKFVKSTGKNTLVVAVEDPTDQGEQPRGKQNIAPEGIWYTPISGIWQTVWLESVPNVYLSKITAIPNLEASSVSVKADVHGASNNTKVRVVVRDGVKEVASATASADDTLLLEIKDAKTWSPSKPFLYDLEVQTLQEGEVVDRVASYFGMRSIKLGKDLNGQTRILLNGEPVFQLGLLDQGYWPDGLYTAPTDEALRYDLEVTKRMGFNMVRKHVKVEPARWYHWCDRIGLLVWQDMPNGGENASWPADGFEISKSTQSGNQYRTELKAMVDALQHFPSIVVWVPFNEAWGQFETKFNTELLQEYDPTRLVNSASGGNDFGYGHMNDDHFYPGPGAPPAERDRAAVLGEFGGLGLMIRGHVWQIKENWGYRSFQSKSELTEAYQSLITKLRPLVESHLSAAVYTQTTDVEVEVNGLITYDRSTIKPDVEAIRLANESLYAELKSRGPKALAAASTLAWWRFEEDGAEGPVGNLQNQMGAIAARDSSGRNNHLYAHSVDTAPSIGTYSASSEATPASINNRHYLNDQAITRGDGSSRDLYTSPEVSQTHMDLLNRFPFSSLTIEASFSLTAVDREQVILAKEMDVSGEIRPLFQLGVFGTPPVLAVEITGPDRRSVLLATEITPTANTWYHTVFTCEDGVAELRVSEANQAALSQVISSQINASEISPNGTWVLGRGCVSGKMGRDFRGLIDEVRISTKKLDELELLFPMPVINASAIVDAPP